jgi:hypothetical protein
MRYPAAEKLEIIRLRFTPCDERYAGTVCPCAGFGWEERCALGAMTEWTQTLASPGPRWISAT